MGRSLMTADFSLYIALAAFALNMIGTVVGVTWKLSRVEVSLRETIMNERKEIDRDLERQAREFGETAQALRQKVTEVELYVRDTFVRRDGFLKITDDFTHSMRLLGEQLNARLDRMEEKFDKA